MEDEEEAKNSLHAVAQQQGVSQKMLLSWLDKELQDEQACIQLPLALLCVCVTIDGVLKK